MTADPVLPRQVLCDALVDVEGVAGLGPEHDAARWAGPERGVDATFTGHNAFGDQQWEVPCTVVVHDPPKAFGWVVGDSGSPTTTWTCALTEDGDGTVVVQRVAHGPGWSYLRDVCTQRPEKAARYVAARAAQLEVGMRTVLAAVASRPEGG